jgi:pimeloyl-ACP methyl ester carboxylesterase
LERFEYQRAHSHVSEVDASHVPMISHPDLVARLIQDAARATN